MRQIITILLFLIGCVIPYAHLYFSTKNVIYAYPFYFEPTIKISVQWFIKDISEILSPAFLFLVVCRVLMSILKHFEFANYTWQVKSKILLFIIIWQRIFLTLSIFYFLDAIHYIGFFKQSSVFFLVSNAIFFILTSYYFYKLYHPKRK